MNQLIDALSTQGYFVWDDFLTHEEVVALKAEFGKSDFKVIKSVGAWRIYFHVHSYSSSSGFVVTDETTGRTKKIMEWNETDVAL